MNQTPCVLFTVDAFLVGGVSSLNQQYIRVLTLKKINVILLGRQGDITNLQEYFHHASIYTIPEVFKPSFKDRIFGIKEYVRYLSIIYRNHNVVAVHMATPWSAFYTYVHPHTWNIKRIINYHGAFDLENASERNRKPTFSEKIGDVIRHYLQFYTMRCSHFILCCSHYAVCQINTHFKLFEAPNRKILIIPGFIQPVRRYFHSNNGHKQFINILNIGRVEPRKGIDVLFDACVLLRDRRVPFKLTLATPVEKLKYNNVLDRYERLNLFRHVQFLHCADERQKRLLFKQADLFVIPSQDLETFGLTIIESLAHGVPVVGTPVGAIPEILLHIDRRLIAKGKQAKYIAETIEWYYHLSNKQKSALRQKSMDRVQKYYSYSEIQTKILKVYDFLFQ